VIRCIYQSSFGVMALGLPPNGLRGLRSVGGSCGQLPFVRALFAQHSGAMIWGDAFLNEYIPFTTAFTIPIPNTFIMAL
jgi:hypothetical protein